ncbi:MAG TPA: sulfotransferase [Thermoanaerobaculia bacterium]|nr:sulfotransferase [Thermoanaerobaculia bacterium]
MTSIERREAPIGDGERMALVVGQRKSGSTWLLNLLSLHPEVRGVHETHLFQLTAANPDPDVRTAKLFARTPWGAGGLRNLPLQRLLDAAPGALKRSRPALLLRPDERPASLLDLPLRDALSLRRLLRAADSADGYCRRFFAFLEDRLRPPRLLVEKSPSHVDYLERIRALFPAAKLVAIHRDGRDAVVSDRFHRQAYEGGGWSLEESALLWRRAIEAELDFARRERLFICSYEELHSRGSEVVAALLDYLGLASDPALVADLCARSSFRHFSGRNPGQEARGRFLRKGVVGDWRNHFTDDHRATFKELAGDLLVTLGYERDLSW